jgi:hypothetical protein
MNNNGKSEKVLQLETFLVVNKENFKSIYPDYVSIETRFPMFIYVKMSDEQEIRRISQRENLDSLYLDLSIVLKWNDEKLLDTNLFELNLWEDLIEAAEVLSKEKSCKVRLGVQTVMLSVEESLQGEVNWIVHDELEVNDIYFKVKLHDKNLLLKTIIDGGISFYSSLIKYKFPNTEYIEYCLNRLKNITI